MPRSPTEIFTEWMAVRNSGERHHALDIAERLSVSECELLASACGKTGAVQATRLSGDWSKLLLRMPDIGHVKTVTRNPHAVIEVEGTYGGVEFFGPMGQSIGSIDLRIFVQRWKFGFAVTDETKRGLPRGLQFFDGSGVAIHKIYLREESNGAVYDAIVAEYISDNQTSSQPVDPPEPPASVGPDSAIDVAGLRAAWRGMKDTHEFFGLLRNFGVARTQALRLAAEDLATPLDTESLQRALYAAKEAALPIMIFVGNSGIIQIHTGAPKKVAPMGPWINILDPGFDLHVRTDRIRAAWIVRKPTADGIVTSLEVYAEDGQQIALLVGKRKPGTPESAEWRALVESLVHRPSS